MTTSILTSKTGQMNMGGYMAEKTAIVFTHTFDTGTKDYFRFKYVSDNCDECFNTLDEAMDKFNSAISSFI